MRVRDEHEDYTRSTEAARDMLRLASILQIADGLTVHQQLISEYVAESQADSYIRGLKRRRV
jgi:hypothetical protein